MLHFVHAAWERVSISGVDLVSHHRFHRIPFVLNSEEAIATHINTCTKCGKVCLSIGGMKRHAKSLHGKAPVFPAR